MTRSQFILGIALLIVSGAMAFSISFRQRESVGKNPIPTENSVNSITRAQPQLLSERPSSLVNSLNRPIYDRTHYDISVSKEEDREAAQRIRDDAREQLEELDTIYQLSRTQRREIFPLIAAHHPEFRHGMLVNGQSIAPAGENLQLEDGGTTFDDALYPILTPDQQNKLQERILGRSQWWGDIVEQLRDDLDLAIENGEMVPEDLLTIPEVPDPASNLPKSSNKTN